MDPALRASMPFSAYMLLYAMDLLRLLCARSLRQATAAGQHGMAASPGRPSASDPAPSPETAGAGPGRGSALPVE